MTVYILVRRDPREKPEEFEHWWRTRHAPLAARMPGLTRYALHRATGFEKQVDWDGVAELQFDSEETARAAFGSDEGRAVMLDAAADGRGGARLMLLTSPIEVVIEGRPVEGTP